MSTRLFLREVVAAAADLAFGSRCAGCDEVPGLLCGPCADVLRGPARDDRLPIGVMTVPLAVTTRYEGVGRAVVIAHKERGRLALAAPLGAALAVAVTAVLATVDAAARPAGAAGPFLVGDDDLVLVPAPSRRSATRSRGHDPMLRTARHAARTLSRGGLPATVAAALGYSGKVADQHALRRAERFANVHGAMAASGRSARHLVGRRVVIVDDVITSGATMTECWRALGEAGVTPVGVAAITAVGSAAW